MNMMPQILSFFIVFSNTLFLALSFSPPTTDHSALFHHCIDSYSNSQAPPSSAFYSPDINKTSFTALLDSTAQNLRCILPSVPKPRIIFTPLNESHVQAAVKCARSLGLNIRVRSGGHDYEGLSYISLTGQPFIIIDLSRLRSISVDIQAGSAWVQTGATVGELYYRISQKSRTHAFPGGLCPSLGMGGHPSGGGYGPMMRVFGLAADNMLDARIVDALGNIHDRRSMSNVSKDFFWAIRGGGGGSFCIILAWQVKLVRVPENVTVFGVPKTLEQNGTDVLYKWQQVADKVDDNLFLRAIVGRVIAPTGKRTVQTLYQALFLGDKEHLLNVTGTSFPELGVTAKDCIEMSWIQSMMYIAGFPTNADPADYLLKPNNTLLSYFKGKSDFLTRLVRKEALEGLWDMLIKADSAASSFLILNPYGGAMSRIPEDQTPFPHRNVLCKIQYIVMWKDGDNLTSQLTQEDWIRNVYKYMGPLVSENPRQAYVNYRDLDIGETVPGSTNCSYPYLWGPKYFKKNFERLVSVKGEVDPDNLFKHEQSIPPSMKLVNQCTKMV